MGTSDNYQFSKTKSLLYYIKVRLQGEFLIFSIIYIIECFKKADYS
jgi:hypothetical protein